MCSATPCPSTTVEFALKVGSDMMSKEGRTPRQADRVLRYTPEVMERDWKVVGVEKDGQTVNPLCARAVKAVQADRRKS